MYKIIEKSVDILLKGRDMQNDTASDNATNDDGEEDFKSVQVENEENEEKNEVARKTKHKATEKSAKKISSSGRSDDLGGADSEDEPLNGSNGVKSPAKKARNSVTQTKATPKKGSNGSKTKKKEEDDLCEEQYKGYTKADVTWKTGDTCLNIIEYKYKKKQIADGEKSKKNSVGNKKRRKSSAKDDSDKEWEVDKIIDYAVEKNGRVFRIRWKGFTAKYDTWEPEENLFCDELLDKFMKRMKQQENTNFRELRKEPKKTKRLVNETSHISLKNAAGHKSKGWDTKKRIYSGDRRQSEIF